MKHKKIRTIFVTLLWGGMLLPLLIIAILLVLINHGVFGEMPGFAELENPKSNIASEVYSEDMKLLGTYHVENRSFVSFDELSPSLVRALVATEDARFARHSGIDFMGLARVAVRTVLLRDKSQGGGSTITQQLAKNLFPRDPNPPTTFFQKLKTVPVFKIKEWITAVKLERNYTKNEIIAMYLNVVPFGSNAFGIRAATQTFFNKQPAQLYTEEAALMAGIVNAPTRFSPVRNYNSALSRRNFVMRQMVKAGFLTKDSYSKLAQLPIVLQYQQEDHNTGIATYFRERVRSIMNTPKPERSRYNKYRDYQADSTEWAANPLYGWCYKHLKPDGTRYDVNRDGLKIYTTINSHMQTYAETSLEDQLKLTLQPALNAEIKNKGGRIWGSSVSAARGKELLAQAVRQSDRYRQLKQDGLNMDQIMKVFNTKTEMTIFTWDKGETTVSMTPLDSIQYYKAFLRAGMMAMDPHNGHIKVYVGGPNFKYFKYDQVKQSKRQAGSVIKPFLYTLAMQEGLSPCHKVPNVPQTFVEGDSTWTPKNAGTTTKDGQMVTLKWGLAASVNNISAWLIKQFNPQSVVDICAKMGITSEMPAVNSIFLGTAEVSLYEMTNAFATFANQGVRVMPVMVTRIEDRNGNVLASYNSTQRTEAISAETAYLMTNLLQGVVNSGTAYRLRGTYHLVGDIGGKTGTTQNQSDAWFMAITPDLAVGTWVGCEDRTVHFESLRMGGGSGAALPIFGMFWQKVVADPTLHYTPNQKFVMPLNMRKVDIDCNESAVESAQGLDEPATVNQPKQKMRDEFF